MPFMYVPTQASIEEVIDGTTDQCWLDMLAGFPANAIFAPIAEMNTSGEAYAGTPAQAALAYERLAGLNAGRFPMCASFVHNDWLSQDRWVEAVLPYVDLICPSSYNHKRDPNTEWYTEDSLKWGLPVILAQTGTVHADKLAWFVNLLDDLDGIEGAIYFDQHQYAMGWPMSGEIG